MKQQLPTTAPAAVNVPQPDLDCEILNLQAKIKRLQMLNKDSHTIKGVTVFYYSKNDAFVELTQNDFHTSLPCQVAEMILNSLQHYEQQLRNLIILRATNL